MTDKGHGNSLVHFFFHTTLQGSLSGEDIFTDSWLQILAKLIPKGEKRKEICHVLHAPS